MLTDVGKTWPVDDNWRRMDNTIHFFSGRHHNNYCHGPSLIWYSSTVTVIPFCIQQFDTYSLITHKLANGTFFFLYCGTAEDAAEMSLYCRRRSRFRRSIKIVTLPTAGKYNDAFSLTSFSKFLSAATLTHRHPSFNHSVFTLYIGLGTAETTTSERARHCWRVNLVGWTTCRGW